MSEQPRCMIILSVNSNYANGRVNEFIKGKVIFVIHHGILIHI